MKSGTSYFSISGSLIRIDFKRYWVLPLMIFVGYFLTGLFVLMVNYRDDVVTAGLISMLLEGTYPLYSIITCAAPVVTAAMVFHYLNHAGSVMTVHSQPFTRITLINSHTVSCMLFCLLPILATGLFLLAMAHPVYYSQDYYANAGEMRNLFTRMEVLRWLIESSLISLFILAVCVFARVISGTGLHHVVAAIGFNLVVPVMILLTDGYMEQYLFGFSSEETLSWIAWSSPALKIFEEAHFAPLTSLIYLMVSAVIYCLSAFLYTKRKLERTGDGIVFDIFNYLITMIWGFLGMTFLGFIFRILFGSVALTVSGYFLGAALGIVICRMIVLKTLHVFNRETMKITGVYAVAALLFFGVLVLNLTGYETRVPKYADYAKISGLNYSLEDIYGLQTSEEGTGYDTDLVKAVHQYIVDNRKDLKKSQAFFGSYYHSEGYPGEMLGVNIRYYRGDKCTMERSYQLPARKLLTSEPVRNLFSSDNYRNLLTKSLPAHEKLHMARIYDSQYGEIRAQGANNSISDPVALASLYEAVRSDLDSLSYEEMVYCYRDKQPVAYVDLTYRTDRNANGGAAYDQDASAGSEQFNTLSLKVFSFNKNTMAWLSEQGYGDYLHNPGYHTSLAVITTVEENDGIVEDYFNGMVEDLGRDALVSDVKTVSYIEDAERLEQLYDKFIPFNLFGREVTTEKDGLYLIRFLNQDSDSGTYWVNDCGYISGEDLNDAG